MRDLKFRAWDKATKKYYGVSGLQFDNGVLVEIYLEDYPKESIESNEDVKRPQDVVIEQYVGLKDKTDKEIHEGDIVLNTYYDDGEMYKVLWVDDSVAFGMESLDDMELYKLPLESLKVIGNIHENAELLK